MKTVSQLINESFYRLHARGLASKSSCQMMEEYVVETIASQSTIGRIKKAEDSKPQSSSTTTPAAAPTTPAPTTPAATTPAATTPAPTTTPKPQQQTPAKPQVSDHQAELERLRGAAALKSLGDSPMGKRLLAGKGRNQRSNEIVSKSIERSGLKRDELVKASPERYGKMVDFASKTNAERAAIGRQAGQAMARALAPKLPNAEKPKTGEDKPKTGEDKPKVDDFAAGGGNAKMKATGMTRDQVIALGQKNLAKQKVTNTRSSEDTMVKASPAPTKTETPKASSTPTKTETPKAGLTDAQLKQYEKAYANRNNPFAKGTIKKAYAGLTPEQQKAFKAHAASQGHDWGDLI